MNDIPLRRRAVHLRRAAAVGVVALAGAALALATGCGRGHPAGEADRAGEATTTTRYAHDDGPLDPEAAEEGAELFQAKGCSACHAFGRRVTGPDLAGVTRRRTRAWIVRMVREPDTMIREDDQARALLAQYAVAMPNLQLSEDEAHEIVEFFRSKDHAGTAGKEE